MTDLVVSFENAIADLRRVVSDLVTLTTPVPALYGKAITDRAPRALPPLPKLGPAGFVFPDPSFGTPLVRVTDEHTDPGGASWHVPSNAHLAAWTADSKRFYGYGNSGKRIFSFDAAAMKATSFQSVLSQAEPQFSRVDPDKLYGVGGPNARTIQSYSLTKAAYTDILDLDTLGLGLATPRTYSGGIVSGGSPEKLAVFFGGEMADMHRYVIVIDGDKRKLLDTRASTLNGQPTSIPLGCDLHSLALDLSGRFGVLYPPGSFPRETAKKIIWDLATDQFTLLPETSARMGGHDALGYGYMVSMEGASVGQPWDAAQWPLRNLATPLTMIDLIDPILRPLVKTLEDHTSWNNALPDRLVPFVSSTFHSGPTTEWRAWDDELLAIEAKAKGLVYRFAHTRSIIDPNNFWTQPIANVSPNGRGVIFTSTWGNSLGADPSGGFRRDIFLAVLA